MRLFKPVYCRIFLRIAAIVVMACGGLLSAGNQAFADEVSRPNIVLIVADDLGYGELGVQGCEDIPTPHLDALANSGVRFTNGYVTGPYCSVSRAGMLTGIYQSRFGYESNPTGYRNHEPDAGLPAGTSTLADRMADAGYACGLVGKWHLGAQPRNHPLHRGFHEFFGFLHEGHYYAPHPYDELTTMLRRRTLPGGKKIAADGSQRWIRSDGRLVLTSHMGHDEPAYDANNPLLRDSQPVAEADYLTDAFTREANAFIDRHQERPFFLYVAYNAVHSPLQAPSHTLKKFDHIEDIHRRIFAGMLHHLDESVGGIVKHLKDRGLAENTLVCFISDNGGPTKELTSSNGPLRGGKGDVYEGGIRIPFLLNMPGTLKPAVSDQPVVSLDLFATATALAGARGEPSDGMNLIPWLTGQEPPVANRELFWRMGPKAAYRLGDWKIVRNDRSRPGDWELYHLSEDVAEENNLAISMPQKLAELVAGWDKLNQQMQN